MKPIDTPPVHPERWPFIKYSHPQCDYIRVPTPGRYAAAIESCAKLAGPLQSEAIAGSVIALAWASTTHRLECLEREYRVPPDPLDVVDELHSAGWTAKQIIDLVNHVIDCVDKSVTTEDEVKEAESFTEATPQNG